MYVCQSVSWLTFLLKLDKYRDISSSVWDIFLKFFWGIPGMFVHLFQIILKFMYVCQSVSCLTSLLKLYKYRDISCSGQDIFQTFLGPFFQYFKMNAPNFVYVCRSVSWLTSLLKFDKYGDISCCGWDIFLNFFWRHYQDVFTLFPNNYKLLVCLLVC